jgi:hypothetical protein
MQLKSASQQAILEAVRYFRPLGFFQEFASQSDEELTATLERMYTHNGTLPWEYDPSSNPLAELALVSYDKQRVWWKDSEADVCEENRVYARTLQEWARISPGEFEPTDIRETWDSDEGPITVKLTHRSKAFSFQPEFYGDWLDLGTLLPAVNETIHGQGIRFEICQTHDQTIFAIVLTREEKAKLQVERGWVFLT